MLYELRNLKRVHNKQAILDISFLTIEAGTIYSLIGPNGAGKTTLLHILAFLDTDFQGTLKFDNHRVENNHLQLLDLRRKVVLVDQHPLLFTGTVWKNIEFGLKVRKVPAMERKERIEQTLETVGMADFAKADSRTLSGGETKRIALARALVLNPDVLLCDEPTANVDSNNQEIILSIFQQLNRDKKRSIIFSTHSLSQVQQLAEQTIQLDAGCLKSPG